MLRGDGEVQVDEELHFGTYSIGASAGIESLPGRKRFIHFGQCTMSEEAKGKVSAS